MTVKEIETAKDGSTIWDNSIKGLHLRVFGKRRVFYLMYRLKKGQQRRPKIGEYGDLTLNQARAQAAKIRNEVAQGIDPGSKTHSKTVDQLFQHYLEVHAPQLAPRTQRDYIAIYNRNIKPSIGRLPLDEVTEQRCAALFHKIQRRAPVQANRTMMQLKAWFNLAEDWGWKPRHTNPVQVKLPREEARERFPNPGESARLLKAIDAIRDPFFRGYLWLLILTGARVGELLQAQWSWINDIGIALPLAKRKKHGRLIALSTGAREVLKQIPRMYENPYIFASPQGKADHVFGYNNQWSDLMKSVRITGLQMRDLRRYFASMAISDGTSIDQLGQVLGHTQNETTRRYAYLFNEKKLAVVESISERLKKQA